VGDPLTPGWASEKGARRLDRSEAATLARIPVHPISAADAERLLRQLSGPVVPEAWRGALGTTYHIGPGPAEVRLRLAFDWSTRPVHSVIATMRGAVEPDQWILYGNHHDAWVHGATDPASGAAALLETARLLAQMRRKGWQPRRTIRFALWDGEEFGLIGSTEWAEKHAATLGRTLVAYLNSDSVLPGRLEAGGSHSLERFVGEVVSQQEHPEGGRPLWHGRIRLDTLGAASDYVAFQQHLGVAALHLGFSGASWGVYHSAYDTRNWYSRHGDPSFAYARTLSILTSVLLARLASAPLLPFEFPGMVRTVYGFVGDAERLPAGRGLDWHKVRQAMSRLAMSAAAVEKQFQAATKRVDAAAAAKLALLNETIYRTERAWLVNGGLPGRGWYRHALYAPGLYSGYTARPLPGIREAVDAGRWPEARKQIEELTRRLYALSDELDRLTAMLRDL
jgi:N-acetylated-alpha-linked acidic dipeptidase